MKKIIITAISIVMAMTLTSCGNEPVKRTLNKPTEELLQQEADLYAAYESGKISHEELRHELDYVYYE